MEMAESDWLRPKQAANYLANLGCFFSPRTLSNLRSNNNAGKGPPFVRSGSKTIRYLKSDLEEWARKQVVRIE
jgi:hypothetical protein